MTAMRRLRAGVPPPASLRFVLLHRSEMPPLRLGDQEIPEHLHAGN